MFVTPVVLISPCTAFPFPLFVFLDSGYSLGFTAPAFIELLVVLLLKGASEVLLEIEASRLRRDSSAEIEGETLLLAEATVPFEMLDLVFPNTGIFA